MFVQSRQGRPLRSCHLGRDLNKGPVPESWVQAEGLANARVGDGSVLGGFEAQPESSATLEEGEGKCLESVRAKAGWGGAWKLGVVGLVLQVPSQTSSVLVCTAGDALEMHFPGLSPDHLPIPTPGPPPPAGDSDAIRTSLL